MDVEWCIGQLTEYRTLLVTHENAKGNASQLDRTGSELDLRLDTVQQIAEALGTNYAAALATRPFKLSTGTYRYTQQAIRACDFLIGKLQMQEVINEKLEPTAPQLSASSLHPWVWDGAKRLWDTGNYREAVQGAATLVNAHVQQLVGRRDVSDGKLMQSAFGENPPTATEPRLRWPGDPNDLTVKSMNEGLRFTSRGLFAAIRNIATHGTEETPQQEALEQLAALSLLARWIEQCDVVHRPSA